MNRKERVLIIDDEENVRISLNKYLTRVGNDVVAASTIEEANSIIQLKEKEIDYAIVDIDFVGNDPYGGVKIIENINKIRPQTKIIICTGYYESDDELSVKLKKIKYSSFLSKGSSGNVYDHILKELGRLKTEKAPKKCFVIMPFSETKTCTEKTGEGSWEAIFEDFIKPVVEKTKYNYSCFKNDQYVGSIIKNIIENLNSADLVVADLTDCNPNVFYELGVRHTLNRPTILITQNLQEVPFDLKNYFCIEYKNTASGLKIFSEKINSAIRTIEESSEKINYSPVGDFLELNT